MSTDVKPSDFLRQVISETGIIQSDGECNEDLGQERDDSAVALIKLAQTKTDRHRCIVCHSEFSVPLLLHKHMVLYHGARREQQCSDCGKRFKNVEQLHVHVQKTHVRRKKFQCSVCEARFDTRANQLQHMRVHRGEKPHACAFCSKTFRTKFMLIEHSRSHTGELPFTCDVCRVGFSDMATFRRHVREHKTSRGFVCDVCDARFDSAKSLVKHSAQHSAASDVRRHQCAFCSAFFSDLNDMEEHVKITHPPNLKTSKVPASVPYTTNFTCSDCQLYYASYEDLSIHLESLHRLYQCRYCFLQYTSKQAHRSHIRQSHGSVFALACYICDKNFTDQGSLDRHITSHDPFNCPHCDESFQEESNLKTHQSQNHNPDIMETCTICSHQFATKDRLQRHLMCHLPPALHKCKMCKAGFNHRRMVDRHMRVVHRVHEEKKDDQPPQTYQLVQDGETTNVVLQEGGDIQDLRAMVSTALNDIHGCNICNADFMQKSDLTVHMNDHDVSEVVLAVVEQERARAAMTGTPAPKKIVVPRANIEKTDEDESDEEMDEQQQEAFMCARPKSAPAVVIKRYTSTRCRFCDKLLASEHDLQIHEKLHVNNFDFRCTACNEEFVDGQDLIQHRQMHKKRLRRSYQCAHCGIIMNDSSLIKQHIDTHWGFNNDDNPLINMKTSQKTNENRFACRSCRLWFDGNLAYRNHMRSHNDGKKYRCPTCKRGFLNMASLNYHQKSHKSVPAYGCGICSQNFDKSYRLVKHMEGEHKFGRFMCRKCDLRFHSKDERAEHEKKHKKKDHYSCAVCESVFITVGALKRHVATHCAEPKVKGKKLVMQTEEQNFWCTICQASFDREEDLIAHGSKHFKCDLCATEFTDAMELESHVLDHAALDKNLCLSCGEQFENTEFLWEHTVTVHSDSQICRCEKCQCILLSHRHSQVHMLTHPLEYESQYHCDHYCNICQLIFTTENFYNIHNERHKPCQICNEMSDDLTLHLLQNHSLPQVEKCYHCDRVLTDPVSRAEHLGTHALKPEVLERCVDCESGFNNLETLDEHVRAAHNLTACKCIVCGMLCLGQDNLAQHLRSEHMVYSVNKCDKCPKIFLNTTVKGLMEHSQSHKPKVPKTCCACGTKFLDEKMLSHHLQTHSAIDNLYGCTICPQKVSSTDLFRDHMRQEHNLVSEIEESSVMCGICATSMKLSAMTEHVKTHLNAGNMFVCQVCSRAVSSKASLERHILTHTDEQPVVCTTCGEGFRNRAQLTIHQLIHSNSDLFTCNICDEQFKLRSKLHHHLIKKHELNTPYSCLICEDKFVDKVQLRDHLQLHGAGGRYPCRLCPLKPNSADNLRQHMKKRHDGLTENAVECLYCLAALTDDEEHFCPVKQQQQQRQQQQQLQQNGDNQINMAGSDPVAIAMHEISGGDGDGFVYIAMDEGMENTCPICMNQFDSAEETAAHVMLHQNEMNN